MIVSSLAFAAYRLATGGGSAPAHEEPGNELDKEETEDAATTKADHGKTSICSVYQSSNYHSRNQTVLGVFFHNRCGTFPVYSNVHDSDNLFFNFLCISFD